MPGQRWCDKSAVVGAHLIFPRDHGPEVEGIAVSLSKTLVGHLRRPPMAG